MESPHPPPDPSVLAERRPTLGRSLDNVADADRETSTLVLADDPTGAQTVRNVPVVMHPRRREDLHRAAGPRSTAGRAHRITFALTDSRAMDEAKAAALTRHLVRQAADLAGPRLLRVISRSDSTLRGHFSAELTAAQQALQDAGRPADGIVFVPCFLEAGRYTIDDIQWIRRDGALISARRRSRSSMK